MGLGNLNANQLRELAYTVRCLRKEGASDQEIMRMFGLSAWQYQRLTGISARADRKEAE